jgi:non-homologous end joining protein Ku
MPQRTFASNVSVNLGMLTTQLDLVPVRATQRSRHTLCPDCAVPTRVNQRLVCPNNPDHEIDRETAPRGIEDPDGNLVPLTAQDLASLGEVEAEPGIIRLSVCPATELEENTRPGEAQYRVRLPKKSRSGEAYAVLLSLASDPSLAFYGLLKPNGRSATQPVRLTVWRGQLVLQSLLRPEALAPTDDVRAEASDELVALGHQFAQASCAPFDPSVFVDARQQLYARLVEGSTEVTAPIAPKTSSLEEMFAAALKGA